MIFCPECGMAVYNGICTNCHEDMIIEQECYEYDIPISEEFQERLEKTKIAQKEYAKRVLKN